MGGLFMAGEIRFRTSLIGYKKTDVILYIERIVQQYEDKLKEKDEEIAILKVQNNDAKTKYEELYKKAEDINFNRAKIADVLLKAQEKADVIVNDAIIQANEEKKDITKLIEIEKEKLVDIKREIKTLKSEFTSTLKKYESQLGEMVKEDEDVDEAG